MRENTPVCEMRSVLLLREESAIETDGLHVWKEQNGWLSELRDQRIKLTMSQSDRIEKDVWDGESSHASAAVASPRDIRDTTVFSSPDEKGQPVLLENQVPISSSSGVQAASVTNTAAFKGTTLSGMSSLSPVPNVGLKREL